MYLVPVLCISCGRELTFLYEFMKKRAEKITGDPARLRAMTQSQSVDNILTQMGFHPIHHACCRAKIMGVQTVDEVTKVLKFQKL